MKVLLDTCVIVDALQDREPFGEPAANILIAAANEKFEGYVTAKSVTDIYYLTRKLTHSNETARKILNDLLFIIDPLDTCGSDCINALHSEISDYEDAVMCATAEREDMYCIVTRNIKDYQNANLPIYTPQEFLDLV